ncbi:hypothetical protein FOZ63_016641, partial [Perkinsus olseni]
MPLALGATAFIVLFLLGALGFKCSNLLQESMGAKPLRAATVESAQVVLYLVRGLATSWRQTEAAEKEVAARSEAEAKLTKPKAKAQPPTKRGKVKVEGDDDKGKKRAEPVKAKAKPAKKKAKKEEATEAICRPP